MQKERPEVRFVRGESLRVRSTTVKHEVLEDPIHVMSSLTVSRAAQQSLAAQEESLGEGTPRMVAMILASLPVTVVQAKQRSRVLENLCHVVGRQRHKRAVVGATPCVNRWGRDGQAFDYTRFGSRARVGLREEMDDISLVCWVKNK